MNTSHKTPEIKVIEPKLPQGGGTIKGMGEKFAPHEFSGAASLSIPIPSTTCRGMALALSLQYSSGNAIQLMVCLYLIFQGKVVREFQSIIIPNTDTFLLMLVCSPITIGFYLLFNPWRVDPPLGIWSHQQ